MFEHRGNCNRCRIIFTYNDLTKKIGAEFREYNDPRIDTIEVRSQLSLGFCGSCRIILADGVARNCANCLYYGCKRDGRIKRCYNHRDP